MINSGLLISQFYAKQKNICYLQSISLHREIDEDDASEYIVRIILSHQPSSFNDDKLEVIFSGVRDFRMGNIDGLFALFIDIADISESQWENLPYKVKENEYDTFSFYCKSFTFIVKQH